VSSGTALDAAGCVELAHVTRSGLIESRHLGAAAVVDGSGSVIRALGDTQALVYPRSTLKPVQAVAVLRAGAKLAGAQIVLASASHCGSPEHLAVVEGMLSSVGLSASDLQCPADWPLGREFANELIRTDARPTRLHMNCSGKHAGFLTACVENDWSTNDYLAPEHPLQMRIRDAVEEFTGEPVRYSGTDGCGAPVHAVSLAGLARATGRITGGTDDESVRLAGAIREFPWAIDGRGRANTLVIEQLGLVAKLGAEGVMVMGAPDGTAVAVKILDGSLRAATLVALELLVQAGVVEREACLPILEKTNERILGGDRVVGSVDVSF
jgi:L-asparaginase II